MRMLCPIKYEIHGTTKTNRRPAKYAYREMIAVDIPELDSADAPVAIEWTPEANLAVHRYATLDREISGPDGKQLTRWNANSHWQRLCDGHFYGQKERGSAIMVEDLESMLASPRQNSAARVAIGLSSPNVGKAIRIVNVSDDPRERFTSIRTDGREDAIRCLDEAVAGLISVDGIVHRKCIEPFISVALDVQRGELRVRDMGIETTVQALWGPTSTTFAFFGLSRWDEAIALVNTHAGVKPANILPEPRILIGESLTYDWQVSYKAAIKAKAMQSALIMFSGVLEPKLENAIVSQDVDEQYEILLSLDPGDPRWADNGSARRNLAKALEILENRTITMSLPDAKVARP